MDYVFLTGYLTNKYGREDSKWINLKESMSQNYKILIGIYLLGIILMTVINSYSSILQSIDEYKVLLIGLGVAFLTKYILNSYLLVNLE